MASSPDSVLIGVELQAAGENLNTWGAPKLNTALTVLARSAHGYQALALSDSTTISGTNYVATNFDEVASLEFTGTLSAAFNVVFPGRQKRLLVKNSTNKTATLKLSASTGFALPASRTALAVIDGSDVENWTPNYIAAITSESGQDLVDVDYLDQAIANISSGFSTNGTVFVTSADISANYLANKITAGTGIGLTVNNPAANENIQIDVDTSVLEDFLALTGKITATLSSGTTAMTANRRYRISSTATGTLPAMTANQFVIVEFTVGSGVVGTVGRNSQTIDGASADDTYTGDGAEGPIILYTCVSSGVVTSTLIGSTP